MNKIIFATLINLLLCGFVSAGLPLAEYERVRQIRILEDDRAAVRRILADYESDFSDEDDEDESFSDDFSTENARIEVIYSEGDCAADDAIWNAEKLRVTKIIINFKEALEIKKLRFSFSGYTKDVRDEDSPNDYVYYDENSGIGFKISDDEIYEINLFPSKGNVSSLCENEAAQRVIAGEERFIELMLKEKVISCVNPVANVDDIRLESEVVFTDCDEAVENCVVGFKEIAVNTVAVDPDNDPLSYEYTVSGGKIVGEGSQVIWDVSGLARGTYTITAAVDDGCGFCGQPKTKTITIK